MRIVKTNITFFITFLIGLNSNIYCQNNLKAKIVSNKKDNLFDISALAENNDEVYKDEYKYLLVSLKKSSSGNYSKNNQSGEFSIKPNELKNLASLKVNVEKDDELKVYLFIRKNNKLISKDSLVFIPKVNSEKRIVKETDFRIKGIVVDNVLTKIGKDFNDFFYQAYNFSNYKYAFVITINERPYMGRNSILSVEVDERKIVEFYAKPDEEYLKSYVQLALEQLRAYNTQNKILFEKKLF